MKKKSNIIVTVCLLLCLFPTGSCNKKEALPINVIPIASTVGNYSILNLSEYATDIKYIPLETNNECLVGAYPKIICEDDKILISSGAIDCYLFDNTGKFCRKIGLHGQGPEDYLIILQTYIYNNSIYLIDSYKILIYDISGHFVEKINKRFNEMPTEYAGHGMFDILPLKKDTYVMNVVSMKGYYPKAILLERYQTDMNMIKEYPNNLTLNKMNGGFMGDELGYLYRYNDEIRAYKGINDTIFSIGQNTEMKNAFIFELGKYKPTLSFFERKEGDFRIAMKNYIHLVNIHESHNHIFITFDFGIYAPESIELPGRQGGTYSNDNVNGVFDKRTGKLTLMCQPIKGKLGFRNDIDGGPVIWPTFISSNNELVTYIHPEEFMEYYDKIDNPSAALKEIAEKISPFDNPIVIVAKLK